MSAGDWSDWMPTEIRIRAVDCKCGGWVQQMQTTGWVSEAGETTDSLTSTRQARHLRSCPERIS